MKIKPWKAQNPQTVIQTVQHMILARIQPHSIELSQMFNKISWNSKHMRALKFMTVDPNWRLREILAKMKTNSVNEMHQHKHRTFQTILTKICLLEFARTNINDEGDKIYQLNSAALTIFSENQMFIQVKSVKFQKRNTCNTGLAN